MKKTLICLTTAVLSLNAFTAAHAFASEKPVKPGIEKLADACKHGCKKMANACNGGCKR